MADIEIIQKLRDVTGAGVMSCKKAFQEVGGDFEKAVALVRERGLVKVGEKSSRSTGSGLLETYIHNGRVGVLLELRCETDFVARSEIFKELAHNLAMQIAAMNPVDIGNLSAQPFIKDESKTIDALIKEVIARLGENTKVERFCRYEL